MNQLSRCKRAIVAGCLRAIIAYGIGRLRPRRERAGEQQHGNNLNGSPGCGRITGRKTGWIFHGLGFRFGTAVVGMVTGTWV